MSGKDKKTAHRIAMALALLLTMLVSMMYVSAYPDVYNKEVEIVDGTTTIITLVPRTAMEIHQIKLAWFIGLIAFFALMYAILYIAIINIDDY